MIPRIPGNPPLESTTIPLFLFLPGPFLLDWMKTIVSSSCITKFLPLVINVIKFNAAYLDEDVLSGLVL